MKGYTKPLYMILAASTILYFIWKHVNGALNIYFLTRQMHMFSPDKVAVHPRKTATRQDYVGLTIDILSIGSNTRQEFLHAQRHSFGSHKAIRHFFDATEVDDIDPNCSTSLSMDDVKAISKFCSNKKWKTHQFLMQNQRNAYASAVWLSKKVNPAGWMCAQTRPSFGFGKVVDFYRTHPELPDYLIIMDDDTYYNIDHFEAFMTMNIKDPSVAYAIAGCMIRSRVREVNFTFPFGGYGIIFSRGSLWNYIRPINCSEDATKDEFESSACWRVQDDQLGEKELFQDGMSVSDLQIRYAQWQPYVDYNNWSTGFCLHSDWMWGFFSNFYNISKHVDEIFYTDVPWSRMDGYNNSELYAGAITQQNLEKRKICNNDSVENCKSDSHICHYQIPASMHQLTEEAKRLFPTKFY